jgi:fructokinase
VIVVIGEILIDIFEDYQRIGGAPFNFAFHLKQLMFPVRFFSRVGNDPHGRRIIDLLKKSLQRIRHPD